MTRQTTSVAIDGTRTELSFGTRYRVRYGRDSKVLEDALLDSRAANGDLVFRIDPDAEGANGGIRRVRPSAIDAIFVDTDPDAAPSGGAEGTVVDFPTDSRPLVPDRLDGETTSAYLARLERELGDRYASWIATETGQATLELVAAEDRAARKDSLRRAGIVGGKTPAIGPKPIGEIFYGGAAVGGKTAALAAAAADFRALGDSIPFVESPTRVVRTTAKGRAKLAELGVADPNPAGTSWKDRNRVWKCGSCGRRLRLASCTGRPDGSHPPVSAPAGSRKETR